MSSFIRTFQSIKLLWFKKKEMWYLHVISSFPCQPSSAWKLNINPGLFINLVHNYETVCAIQILLKNNMIINLCVVALIIIPFTRRFSKKTPISDRCTSWVCVKIQSNIMTYLVIFNTEEILLMMKKRVLKKNIV